MNKLNLSKMRTKVSERPLHNRDYMYYCRERIKELRQRLYQLMRITNGK